MEAKADVFRRAPVDLDRLKYEPVPTINLQRNVSNDCVIEAEDIFKRQTDICSAMSHTFLTQVNRIRFLVKATDMNPKSWRLLWQIINNRFPAEVPLDFTGKNTQNNIPWIRALVNVVDLE